MLHTKNKKKLSILHAAKDLFWKHGFRRVSVEEVCQYAHVSKMTFYKYFPNKIDLAKAVFDLVMEENVLQFHTTIRENISAEDKIKKMILLKLEGTNDISNEFLQDFYSDTELGLKEFIEVKTQEAWKLIMDDFVFAQEKGWFRKDINPALFLIMAQKMTELINNATALRLYQSPQNLIMAITNLLMYGLLPHNKIEDER